MFVFVGYNFGDQRETDFLGSGNMPKRGSTHAQVCKGSSVMGHAPRKALGVKKAMNKGVVKHQRKAQARAGTVEKAKAVKVKAADAKAFVKAKAVKAKAEKAVKAVTAVTAAELGLGSDSGTPQPRSPTYEPTEAWVMDVAARIDAATLPGAFSGDAAGAGPEKTAPEGGRQAEKERDSGKRVCVIFGGWWC